MAAPPVSDSSIQIGELISHLARVEVRTGFLLRKKHYSCAVGHHGKYWTYCNMSKNPYCWGWDAHLHPHFWTQPKQEGRRHKELAGCCIIWSLQRVLVLGTELNLGEFDFPFPAPIPLLTFYSRNQLGLDQPLIESSQWGALMHFICSYCS